jgi:hypothetical protein
MQARLDSSLQVPIDRAWTPPDLQPRTYYSVALDYFAKPGGDGSSYWVRNPGKQNFLLLDRSPEHVSLHRVFRAASILATASLFTRPSDPNKADRCESCTIVTILECWPGLKARAEVPSSLHGATFEFQRFKRRGVQTSVPFIAHATCTQTFRWQII